MADAERTSGSIRTLAKYLISSVVYEFEVRLRAQSNVRANFRFTTLAALILLSALPLSAAAGEVHIFSYDPVSPAAKALTATGLSFEFERGFLGSVRIQKVIQTGDRGSAELKPAPESELGQGGLRTALGETRPAGPLYEILGKDEGKAFVHAVCPGADRAWLLIGRLDRFKDLQLQAVGRRTGDKAAHACPSLAFSFRSDWRLPGDEPPAAQLHGGVGPS